MKIEVVVASEKHLSYVTAINDAIDQAAKARGTGIARRTDEYIADKIRNGKAIIALNREEFVGFCYIESWGHQKFVANSGLIVVPAYRGLGVAKQIKEAAFHLSRRFMIRRSWPDNRRRLKRWLRGGHCLCSSICVMLWGPRWRFAGYRFLALP